MKRIFMVMSVLVLPALVGWICGSSMQNKKPPDRRLRGEHPCLTGNVSETAHRRRTDRWRVMAPSSCTSGLTVGAPDRLSSYRPAHLRAGPPREAGQQPRPVEAKRPDYRSLVR